MKSLLIRNFFLFSFLAILISIYYNFDINFPLENNFFPWDSHYYAKLAYAFKNNLSLPEVSDPWGYRLLFPFIFGKISAHFDLSLYHSAIIINILALFFSLNIYMHVCEKKNVDLKYYLAIIFLYLLYWNGQLRHTIFLGGYSFAFDTFCVSLYLYSLYRVLINQEKHFEFLVYFCSIVFIFQRPIVILFIPFFIYILFIFFSKYKITNNILNLKDKNFLIRTFIISLITFVFSKLTINVADSGYSAFHMIFTSIQFNLNLSDLLYIFYFSIGPIFLYFLTIMYIKKKIVIDIFVRRKLPSSLNKEDILIIIYLLIGLFFTLIGGADSDRFLLWFIIVVLLPFTIHSEKIFKKNKLIFIFFIIISLFWSRFFIPSMPPLSFSTVFESNNHVQTNYDDKYFYGPKILKKYQNPTEIILIDGKKFKNIYLLKNQALTHSVEFPINQYCLTCKWYYRNSQVHPYKYRLADLPIPIGYLHNQRNALIDHPKAGHRMIRFIYVLQWLIIQIFAIYLFRKSKVIKM